jgi:hypothetical protein
MRLGSVILLIWLIIGAFAAGNRGEFKSSSNCSNFGTIAVTVIAGPLNYAGVDPRISCHVSASIRMR